ncbi:MAG: flagellar biosynthetic protein FliR, partial [Proteobacteria bacterium]|nr:flagellar biosynthetic protein FliR [Pseudomonadota bacterium]
ELQPELGALITASVLIMIVVLDFHTDAIRAAIESYSIVPMGSVIRPDLALDRLVAAATQSLQLSIRIAGPFILAGIILNFAFGIVNKIAPQVPVIFISAPFLMAASLYLLRDLAAELVGEASRILVSLMGGIQ